MKKKPSFPHILETHLVDHCNLNCKGCSHFAPLVKGKVFADVEIFNRDMERLKQLFGNIFEIRLMGGEPLLHPGLFSFVDIARKAFPNARIAIFTNGILLSGMNDTFWKTCAEKKILVKISYYPIDLKLPGIIQKAKENNVRIKLPAQIKHFFKHLNIDGNSDPDASFRNCRLMFKTPQLRDGKIYPCFFPAYAHIFNNYFDRPIDVTDNDFVNIFETNDPTDILNLLDRPVPMCRWCLTRRKFEKWDLSRQDIHEWIGSEAATLPHLFRKLNYGAINLYHAFKKGLNQ
ncbi:MAG: 4Fe-4S cluster-binding domain-containing protein [Desulfobacteraceae bacterium]|nr:MAG: 4Fe-4S cluster-binding domain-containing protein [Desulfobacteraceae bacterium]